VAIGKEQSGKGHAPNAEPVFLPIRVVENADALSKCNCWDFFMQVPQARQEPIAIPPGIMQALVVQQPDWTAVSWTDLLATNL